MSKNPFHNRLKTIFKEYVLTSGYSQMKVTWPKLKLSKCKTEKEKKS